MLTRMWETYLRYCLELKKNKFLIGDNLRAPTSWRSWKHEDTPPGEHRRLLEVVKDLRKTPWKRFQWRRLGFYAVSPSTHQDRKAKGVFDAYFHHLVFHCVRFVFPFHGNLIC